MLCVTASNNILENGNLKKTSHKLCVTAVREEDMLCVTGSFMMKICCVLLPTSL